MIPNIYLGPDDETNGGKKELEILEYSPDISDSRNWFLLLDYNFSKGAEKKAKILCFKCKIPIYRFLKNGAVQQYETMSIEHHDPNIRSFWIKLSLDLERLDIKIPISMGVNDLKIGDIVILRDKQLILTALNIDSIEGIIVDELGEENYVVFFPRSWDEQEGYFNSYIKHIKEIIYRYYLYYLEQGWDLYFSQFREILKRESALVVKPWHILKVMKKDGTTPTIEELKNFTLLKQKSHPEKEKKEEQEKVKRLESFISQVIKELESNSYNKEEIKLLSYRIGVRIYHILSGKSELNDPSFLIEGYKPIPRLSKKINKVVLKLIEEGFTEKKYLIDALKIILSNIKGALG